MFVVISIKEILSVKFTKRFALTVIIMNLVQLHFYLLTYFMYLLKYADFSAPGPASVAFPSIPDFSLLISATKIHTYYSH